ncbi:MAG: Yip1 family protein [Desulfatiglandaceae bacterium]
MSRFFRTFAFGDPSAGSFGSDRRILNKLGLKVNFNREPNMASITDRMIRAAKLDVNLYEEVEADKGAMGQAMAVVVLSSVAAGIGTAGTEGIKGLVLGTVVALAGWFIWAFLTYYIGTRLLPEPQTKADYGELLRTIGFSSSPGMLRVLGIIPMLGNILNFICGIWMLVAMVIAVRQALDYKSTGRAVGVCLIGWIVQIVIFAMFFGLAGGFNASPG